MMTDALRKARQMHRGAIEGAYDGICRIYGMQPVKDPETKVTRQEEVLVQEGIPCHLSFSSAAPAAGSSTFTMVQQTVKLFLAPETVVPPGSRIVVEQQGRCGSYAQSGKAAVYPGHQEVMLELWKGYA